MGSLLPSGSGVLPSGSGVLPSGSGTAVLSGSGAAASFNSFFAKSNKVVQHAFFGDFW